MEQKLISVVIAVYNRAQTLEQCLTSLFAQSFQQFEVVVIDGGSSDGTVDVIRRHQAKLDYWISEPDEGIYDAWNKALTQVKGEWVCFIGSDDYLRDNLVFEKLAVHLAEVKPSTDFLYSKVVLVNDHGEDLSVTGRPWSKSFKSLLRGMSVPHPAMMHRASLFKRDNFEKTYRIAGDYAFFLKHARENNVAFASNVTSICMRQSGISSQQGNFRIALMECRRAQKSLGYTIPSMGWLTDKILSESRNLAFLLLGERRARRAVDLARAMFGMPKYWTRI